MNKPVYRLKIKEWPQDERPREKCLNHGAEALSDSELLALLIGSGTGSMTAVDLGKQLLIAHRNLGGLSASTVNALTKIKGIGPACAARIAAAFELGRRASGSRDNCSKRITQPKDVYDLYGPMLRDQKIEWFYVLLLNSANRITRDVKLSKGTLNASLVHPREVFKSAVDNSAAGLILLHNHPSGDPNPSKEDHQVTEQMTRAGSIMGIPVLDHIIVAKDSYYSYAENNRI